MKQTIAKRQRLYSLTTPTLRLVPLCLDLGLQRRHRFPPPPVSLVLVRRRGLSVTVHCRILCSFQHATFQKVITTISQCHFCIERIRLPQTLHSSTVLTPGRSQQRRPLDCILLAPNQDKENCILHVHLSRRQGLQHRRRLCLRQKKVFPTNPC